ncbi:MAG: Gfo/Idh/MocA family protein [Geminicoccaceae bacterium]
MAKLRWGIISTAKIGVEHVMPAIQASSYGELGGIASRNRSAAVKLAEQFAIPRSYGSYEELLADPTIDVVYNPLPNDQHLPVTLSAVAAGKHVLCEKPLSLTAVAVQTMLEARERHGRRIQEAFMVRTHPQWLRAREIVTSGALGQVRAIQCFFSYFNDDPNNIRNWSHERGGGGMYDIGCYPTTTSRFLLGSEPEAVMAIMDIDPRFAADRLGSVMLRFPGDGDGPPIVASFTYSTQCVPYQRMQVFGSEGRLEIEIPFNAPSERSCRLFTDDGAERGDRSAKLIEVEPCDQYRLEIDAFAKSIIEGTPQPVPLEDSLAQARVLDAAFRSAKTGQWERP